MAFFNPFAKNKAPAAKPLSPAAKPAASAPLPAAKPLSVPDANVSADDFFADLDNRKKRPKKVDDTIAAPEITGLRDAPPPRPACTLADYSLTIDTSGLKDKTLVPDSFRHGDISAASVSGLDTEGLPDKTLETPWTEEKEDARQELSHKRAAKAAANDADSFFGDIDRKKKRRRVNSDIDVPAVTGLRDAPLPMTVSSIDGCAAVSTDGLRDKTADPDNFRRGDISAIDTGSVSLAGLRPESE